MNAAGNAWYHKNTVFYFTVYGTGDRKCPAMTAVLLFRMEIQLNQEVSVHGYQSYAVFKNERPSEHI